MITTADQAAVLRRLGKGRLVLSGSETDAERLALLQLYMLGYVQPIDDLGQTGSVTSWHITEKGRRVLPTIKP